MNRRRRHGRWGRPALDPAVRRSIPLTTWVNSKELGRILKRVAETRYSLSAYLRTAAMSVKINPPLVPPVNYRLVGDLGRVGNNLNQLVHAIHARRAAPGLAAALEELRTLLDDVRRELIGLQPPPPAASVGDQGEGVPALHGGDVDGEGRP